MRKPRIKQAHYPILRPSGAIWIGSIQYGLGAELDGEDVPLVWQVCQIMDGSRTRDDVISALTRDHAADRVTVERIIDFLISSGWVEDAGADSPDTLSQRDVERYRTSAHFLSWVDQKPRAGPYELQARLKASHATVIGVGGIGSAVAGSLAASGVGRLHCVDGDTVELSNLNRQVLFTEADIGRPKVEALTERLRALNSDIDISGSHVMVDGPDSMAREVAGSDIFINCADQPLDIQNWSNTAALQLGMPWVTASYTGPMLAVASFIPGHTGCYRCLVTADRRRMEAAGKGDLLGKGRAPGFHPVIAPTAQMSGQLAAMEAIYYLLGMKVQTAGRQLHRNFLDYTHQYYLDAPINADCDACSPYGKANGGGLT